MTPYQVEFRRRAAAARALRIAYHLGAGGRHPDAATPADDRGRCDCSGLVAWLGGRDRLEVVGGKEIWYSTRGIVEDARADAAGGKRYRSGKSSSPGPQRRFREVAAPDIGDLLVYVVDLDAYRAYGHVSGVTGGVQATWTPAKLESWRALRVTHCHGPTGLIPAVEETSALIWGRLWGKPNGTVILRPV